MNPLRLYVCDDEPLAIERLVSLLSRIENVVVVGTASDGDSALASIRDVQPDLVLLDIEMPEGDGFDVVENLARDTKLAGEPPLIAFVTAFRKFAPQAFDTGAIDFLCKPVRLGRLEATVDRARQAISRREAERRLAELEAMLGSLREAQDQTRDAHVWVSRRGEGIRVNLDQIEWISAEGAYVRLHINSDSYLHREAIGSIEARLDTTRFIRAHRSHIVRTDHVASIRRTLHGASELLLRDGERVPLGRKYARAARARLLER